MEHDMVTILDQKGRALRKIAAETLRGVVLVGARLRGARLEGQDLAGAVLDGADLAKAKLSGCNLTGAKLRGTCLSWADLRGAKLIGADLTEANLLGQSEFGKSTLLEGADLIGACLDGVLVDHGTRWPVGFCARGAMKESGRMFHCCGRCGHRLTEASLDGLVVFGVTVTLGAGRYRTNVPAVSCPYCVVPVQLGREDGVGYTGGWLGLAETEYKIVRFSADEVEAAARFPKRGTTEGAAFQLASPLRGFGKLQLLVAHKADPPVVTEGRDARRTKETRLLGLLPGAKMAKAPLAGAQLNGMDIRGIDFNGADLSSANLSNANLAGASLLGADLRLADLTGCNLDGAEFDAATRWPASSDPVEHGAILRAPLQIIRNTKGSPIHGVSGDNLRGATLRGADLGSKMPATGVADFRGLDLAGVDFSGAVLRWADFAGADLSRANFTGADLYFARFLNAKLTGTIFSGAKLRGTDFRNTENTQAVNLTIPRESWLFRMTVGLRRSGVFEPGDPSARSKSVPSDK